MVLKRSFGVVFLASLVASTGAFAQVIRVPATALTQALIGQDTAVPTARVIQFVNEEAITVSLVPAPNLGATAGGGANWMKVEFHYGVNPENPQKYPYVDSVEFKIWIEGRDLYAPTAPGPEGVAVCLTGSCTYVNVAATKDGYGSFYVNPTALTRYCGSGSPEDFDRKFDIHVEANVGGKVVDYYNKNKETDLTWYTKPVAVPNMVFRQDQCPFMLYDVDRYPQIKLQTPAQ